MNAVLACPVCRAELPLAPGAVGAQDVVCTHCRETMQVETFPAMWQAVQKGRVGEHVTGDEAACFVHTDRRAQAACDLCGRFMCALCEVSVGEKRICVDCLERGRREGKLEQIERSRTLFAVVAIRVALFGVLLGPFAPAAGLSAIVLAIAGLLRRPGLTGRRYVGAAAAAIVLGFGLVGFWTVWWMRIIQGTGTSFLFFGYE